jgi:N-acetylglutamate synthase
MNDKTGDILLREFVAADYERAYAFWSSVDGLGLNESDSRERIVAFLERNPGFSAVATNAAGAIVGTILCGHNGRSGSLYHLGVARELRGRGLGRRLVEHCFAKLAAADIPRCNIVVFTSNEVGYKFWMSGGWTDPTTWKILQKQVPPAPR